MTEIGISTTSTVHYSNYQTQPLWKRCLLLLAIVVSCIAIAKHPTDQSEEPSFLDTGHISEEIKAQLHNITSLKTESINKKTKDPNAPLRILYIITTLAEYNSGKRHTERGSDRLEETLIPVMRESVQSLLSFGYHVDVFLICHWDVKPHRLERIRDALPSSTVNLEYWDSATPLGYKLENGKGNDLYVKEITRSLARQHRFVIKEKFLEYDFFAAFEDDMMITGPLVEQNIRVATELARLKELAPEEPTDFNLNSTPRNALNRRFYGQLTKRQLSRMMPGLMRVEVLLDEEKYPTQNSTGPIPVDLDFDGYDGTAQVHPEYCCHIHNESTSKSRPMAPTPDKLFLWETNILALGLHKMPVESKILDWVLMQRGPNPQNTDPPDMIGDYYSGRHGEFGDTRRPNPTQGMYVNNQGGWMASRDQIWEWHTSICPGGFLPPYDAPHYNLDGKDLRNVEYWSGGLQLFTKQHACNLQRIIPLNDPRDFSKHLIYHTANNKQRQLVPKRERCFSKVNTLLGQLNHVRKKAGRDYRREMLQAEKRKKAEQK